MGLFPLIMIEPTGGICNRMRSLISASQLATDAGVALVVLWKLDQHLNCRFDELFERPREVRAVIHVGDNRRYLLLNTLLMRLFRRRLVQPDIEAMNHREMNFLDYLRGGSVFIQTYSRFYRDCDYRLLSPSPHYLDKVGSYGLDSRSAVGVHIRRTDHNVAIANSPTDLFVDAMHRELEQQPDTVFFLATDSPEEEQALRRLFPDRIISHPKTSLDRKQPAAIKDALVDLYCLSRCRKLIGSYWSSFTDTAAAMNGIEVEVVKKNS